MSILQFVWQLTILFGIGILVLIGLFASPWYILAAALLIVLVLIQRWMPDPNLQLDLLNESDRPGTAPQESGTEPTPPHPEILYRGATYAVPPDPIPVPASEKPTPKQYRGATYSQPSPAPVPIHPAPAVLRYRGVPYNAETTPDPEATPKSQSATANPMQP